MAVPGLKRLVKRLFRRFGLDIARHRPQSPYPPDIDANDVATYLRVKPYTMTSIERVVALMDAVRYVVAAGIPGAFVECGVWRGGSMMAAALTLLEKGAGDRELFLFDTFDGMPPPGVKDVDLRGSAASPGFEARRTSAQGSSWCHATLADVRRNVESTGYDARHVHFVAGLVEETLPAQAPNRIALLRLDTDWYQSTRHELTCLYPRLASGGVLIIDDYGHWHGARAAVDEYFAASPTLLHRIDYTGRALVKR